SRAQENGLRTQTARMGGCHRAGDTEAAGSIVGRADHPAPVRVAANDDRLAPQCGIIELLDGREEAIEVGMEHPAESPGWNHHVRRPLSLSILQAACTRRPSLCPLVYRIKNKWSS